MPSVSSLRTNRLLPVSLRSSLPRYASAGSPAPSKSPTSKSLPSTTTEPSKELVFDQVTHTGQAWEETDYRMSRFDISAKQVNPNIAMHLVAEDAPTPTHDRVVFCDGGHPALGHPRVYINLDKPGNHICQYCGHRFVNTHVTLAEQAHHNVPHV